MREKNSKLYMHIGGNYIKKRIMPLVCGERKDDKLNRQGKIFLFCFIYFKNRDLDMFVG